LKTNHQYVIDLPAAHLSLIKIAQRLEQKEKVPAFCFMVAFHLIQSMKKCPLINELNDG